MNVMDYQGCCNSLSLKNRIHFGSVGKRIPGVKIKIKNKNKDKIGEILFKSNQMFLGYLSKEGKIEKSIDKKGYFNTGDLGFFKQNHLYFVGRKKNMIKIKGKSVYPEDIENIIFKSRLVKDCAISSFKNRLGGATIPVYVLKTNKIKIQDLKIIVLIHYHLFTYQDTFLKLIKYQEITWVN